MNTQHPKSEKRRRNKQLIIRLTDSELSEFEKKMQKSKLRSRANFIMALVWDKPIIVPEGFRELAVELKREGNNFNQCLHFMHGTQTGIPEWTIKTAANNMNNLYKKISDMLDGLNMVNENADL